MRILVWKISQNLNWLSNVKSRGVQAQGADNRTSCWRRLLSVCVMSTTPASIQPQIRIADWQSKGRDGLVASWRAPRPERSSNVRVRLHHGIEQEPGRRISKRSKRRLEILRALQGSRSVIGVDREVGVATIWHRPGAMNIRGLGAGVAPRPSKLLTEKGMLTWLAILPLADIQVF